MINSDAYYLVKKVIGCSYIVTVRSKWFVTLHNPLVKISFLFSLLDGPSLVVGRPSKFMAIQIQGQMADRLYHYIASEAFPLIEGQSTRVKARGSI